MGSHCKLREKEIVQWEKFVEEALYLSLQNHYVMGKVEVIEPCKHMVFLLVWPLQGVVENAETDELNMVLVAGVGDPHSTVTFTGY